MARLNLIISVFFSSTLMSYGQYNISNNTLIDTSINQLFVGIKNEIIISPNNETTYDLRSTKGIHITKISKNKFDLIPKSIGIDTLLLVANKRIIYRKVYVVEKLPNLVLALGSLKEGLASKEEIIANKRLQIYFPNCKCPMVGYIRNFSLSFVSDNITVGENYFSIEGNMLNEKAMSIIRKLRPKDQIVFENVFIQDIDAYPVTIKKFVLTLK